MELSWQDIISDRIASINAAQQHTLYKHLFNENLEISKYLNSDFSITEMRFIAKIRSEMLPLLGRPWSNAESKICTLCNLKVEENTVHFLGECPVLREFRIQHFGAKIILYQECISILNNTDNWHNLAKYVKQAFNYRKFLMDNL